MAVQGKKLTKEIEDKILSSKLLDPEQSLRDIAKSAEVSHVSVMNVLDESPELLTSITTEKRTDLLMDTLDSIIEDGNKVIAKFLGAIEGNPEIAIPVKTYNDLNAISGLQERAWKQKQIIKGGVTDRVDIGDYSTKTQKELEEARKNLLG